jgi:hypothetical protein
MDGVVLKLYTQEMRQIISGSKTFLVLNLEL